MTEKSSKSAGFERFVPVLLIISIFLAFAVGVLWQKVSNLEKTKYDNKPSATPVPNLTGKLSKERAALVVKKQEADHVWGAKDAEVSIIIYDDLECPYCKKFHVTVKQALEEFDGKVNMIYRHFPLDMLHSNARAEAEASECVAKYAGEEAFVGFIDKIFEVTPSNNQLDQALLSKYAVELGVKKADFDKCVKDRETKDIVSKQEQEGGKAGVTGTPGVFVVNDKGDVWQVAGAVPLEMLKSTLNEALK
jgi:protein-disulfide isomerase